MEKLQIRIEILIDELAKQYDLHSQWEWIEEFYSNHNHPDALSLIRDSASQQGLKIIERDYPFKWGEDFGLFTQQLPGVMFGIGIGENAPALHTLDYDFCDDILPTAIDVMAGVIHSLLYPNQNPSTLI